MKERREKHTKSAAKTAASPSVNVSAAPSSTGVRQSVWLKFLPPVVCLLCLLAAGVCLVSYESDFLWKAQELNLHLDTQLFYTQQLVVPGGFLTWMGTWMTEYFFHPALGTFILCLWWVLLMALAWRAFRVPVKYTTLLLIPVALLLLTCVDMGYWIYYLKLRGHFFVATIGLCVLCAAVWAFRCLPARFGLRPLFAAIIPALLFPITGFYALLTALVLAVLAWRLEGDTTTGRVVTSVVALLAIVAVPLIFYRTMFYQTSMTNIWWSAMPLYVITEEHTAYYIPYILISAFFVAMAATYRLLPDDDVKSPLRWGLCQGVLLLVLAFFVQMFWYRDYNFHKELAMQRCMEQEDWQGMVNEATNLEDEPTRAIVIMKNLALFRLGCQGETMYQYLTGAKACGTPIPVNMTQVVGRSAYFYYGLPNYCYRWCLEDGVEFGWRAEYLKYLIRSALVNGEDRVVRKYIDILKHTRYHREWAESQERFLKDKEALAADKGYSPVFHLMNFKDQVSSDQSVMEKFLMYHFVNDRSDDPLYIEQAVNAALWTKDIQTFWPIFFSYANMLQKTKGAKAHMPTHYQEAAYLYGHLEKNVNISNMPFDESVKRNYENFMKMAERCQNMSEEQMKEAFFPQYGKTFYYEYFLIRNQKLY